MNYNGAVYFYIRNVQGEIIKLISETGTVVVEYTYDAWGNILSTVDNSGVNLGAKNPFRYKGYYYDTETQLYYLNARYYNPEWGRFINADSYGGRIGQLLSHNLFTYCINNPVNMADQAGSNPGLLLGVLGVGLYKLVEATLITLGIVTAAAVTAEVVTTVSESIPASSSTIDWTIEYPPQVYSHPEIAEAEAEGTPKPSIPYPTDPTKSPGPNWEWKGNGDPGSGKGQWVNPGTGEKFFPDSNHELPIGPHMDYSPNGVDWYRWFPYGNILPK